MKGLLNVFGRLWHSYNESSKVLDAEISTRLDKGSGIYYYNEFMRTGLPYDTMVCLKRRHLLLNQSNCTSNFVLNFFFFALQVHGIKNALLARAVRLMEDAVNSVNHLLLQAPNKILNLFDIERVKEASKDWKSQILRVVSSFGAWFPERRWENEEAVAEDVYNYAINILDRIQNFSKVSRYLPFQTI